MVLHLSFSGKFYGRENAAFSLVRALQEKIETMMLLVIETRTPEEDRTDLIAKLAGFSIDHKVLYTRGMFSLDTVNELACLFQQTRPSVIHCHCHKSAFYALLLKKLNKVDASVVFTLHGLVLPFGAKSLLHYSLHYLCIGLADGIIGCSREIVEKLSRTPFLGAKTTAIQNGYQNFAKVECGRGEARQRIASVLGDLADKVVVVNIGRLAPQKNPLLFLKIVKRTRDYCAARGIPVHFIMAGDGELREQVERCAQELALADCLTIAGYVAEMQLLYAAADVLILTSDWEGTPMCILEAMSYSLPTVAPMVGGIPDVLEDGVTGLLFQRRCEEECFRQLTAVIDSCELRDQIGRRAYDFYQNNLNYQKWSSSHLEYYDMLTSPKS